MQRITRIRRSAEYQRVYRSGLRRRSRWFTVFAVSRDGVGDRMGITASRKVGNAVVRNRCKRRLRELGWLFLTSDQRPGLDIVVNAHRELGSAPWSRLCREFEKMVRDVRRRLGAS